MTGKNEGSQACESLSLFFFFPSVTGKSDADFSLLGILVGWNNGTAVKCEVMTERLCTATHTVDNEAKC